MSIFNWTKVDNHKEISFIRFDYYTTRSGKYAIRLLSGFGIDKNDSGSPIFAEVPTIKYRASKHLARRTAFQLLASKGIKDSLISSFDDIKLWGES
ncbi:MAG: hypothetical protein V7765_21355 [Oleispira sp.]